MAYDDAPKPLKDYLMYLDIAGGKSEKTIYEYYLDLRNYLRFVYRRKNGLNNKTDIVDIHNIDIEFIKSINLEDTYEYLYYLKKNHECSSRTLNRKICSIRGLFKYLTNKSGDLMRNPMENIESASFQKPLPKYLSLDESTSLLKSVDGANEKRDYAILSLFLNCGMRLGELVGINLSDLNHDFITITGKGNKQRSIYLNKMCIDAINDYLKNERPKDNITDDARQALFISRKGNRVSRRTVQHIVEIRLNKSGLGDKHYSTHKLRHTAATLMHKYGGVDIRVLQEILGHENLGTTQIYTHVDSEQVKNAIETNPISKVKINHEHNE